MGILGRVLHYLWIKNDLKKVFDYRKEVINRIFANDEALEKNKEEK